MKNIFRLITLSALIFLIGADSLLLAQRTRRITRKAPLATVEALPPKQLTPERQRRLNTFVKVWETINEHYFDGTFNNNDWAKIRIEYQPRLEKIETDAELHQMLSEMIGSLNVSHLAIVLPEAFEAINEAKIEAREREKLRAETDGDEESEENINADIEDDLRTYGIGIDVRLINDRVIITRVEKGSSGESAGLKLGYEIKNINGVDLPELIKLVDKHTVNSTRVRRFLPFELVNSFLNGESDSSVELTYINEQDKPVEVVVPRLPIESTLVSMGENFPPSHLIFESRSLGEGINYIRFNNFSLSVLDKFCNAVGNMKDNEALVIDLRGNVGGIIGISIGLAGMLTDKEISLGTSIYRVGEEALTASSKLRNFAGPVAILVDEVSVSSAEIFSVAMQDAKRGRIFGKTTAGETLPAISVDLETGASLMFPIANYRSPSGKFLEGVGVKPDEEIALAREDLLKGRDPQLDSARTYLKTKLETNKKNTTVEKERAEITVKMDPMPPPPPAPKPPPPRASGNMGTGTSPGAPPAPPSPPVDDVKALQVIKAFSDKVGGIDGYEKILSYEMKGSITRMVYGAMQRMQFSVYRELPNKYAETMYLPEIGEIREIRNGTSRHIKADYGLDSISPFIVPVDQVELLAPIRTVISRRGLTQLKYGGEFTDADGQKMVFITGLIGNTHEIMLTFNISTGFLKSVFVGGSSTEYDDFRKVGEVMLPFKALLYNSLALEFEKIDINLKLDPKVFEPKINCYDTLMK